MTFLFHPKYNRGEEHGRSKLKDSDVISIRNSEGSCRLLAMRHDVDPKTISRIKRGETWKHLL